MKLYHYTKGYHIEEIIETGVIRPATLGVPEGERLVVWFSSNPVWENTVSATSGKEILEKMGGGLYRIVVDTIQVPVKSWSELRFLAHMNPNHADRLEEIGKLCGADPSEWFGTFHPVPREKWEKVEYLKEEKWMLYAAKELLDDAYMKGKKEASQRFLYCREYDNKKGE